MSFRPRLPLAASLLSLITTAALAEPVRVDLRVTPPKDTDPAAKLYVTGSLPALGPWNPSALPLTRNNDGTYSASFTADRGTNVEFKITRGTWATVEKGPAGEELPNRRLTPDADPTPVHITVSSWSAGPTSRPSTRTGDIRTHDAFQSQILHNTRRLWVYLPPSYDKSPETRYPVLYMHDGQNCFDVATSFSGEWQADESAQRLINAGKITPIIIVAIDNNADRMHEYTPTRDPKYNSGGRGADYAKFLVTEAKPFIDRTYRTLPDPAHTATAGSSLGGLISLYLAQTYPQTFSRIGALSPALQWDNANLLKQLSTNPTPLKDHLIYLDMGTAEGPGMIDFTRQLTTTLNKAGLQIDKDYRYTEAQNAPHNESAWAQRFPDLLQFFFPSH